MVAQGYGDARISSAWQNHKWRVLEYQVYRKRRLIFLINAYVDNRDPVVEVTPTCGPYVRWAKCNASTKPGAYGYPG